MKQYVQEETYDSSCTITSRKGCAIRCFSRKKFEDIQKKGGILAGSVNGKAKDALGVIQIDEDEVAYANLEYNRNLYRAQGYILCDDNTYLVVLKRSWRKILLLLLFLLLLLLPIMYFVTRSSGPDLEPGLQKFKAAAGMPDGYGETSFIIPAYNPIQMEAGSDQAGAALWNPEKNQVYFKFTILLDSDNSTVYESKLVPPGMALRQIQFNRRFEKGEYPITIRVSTYDVKEYEQELNSGVVKTSLIALELKQ